MSHDDLERQLYDNRVKAMLEMNSIKAEAERNLQRGLERGTELGIVIGEAKGIRYSILSTLKYKFGPDSQNLNGLLGKVTDVDQLGCIFDLSMRCGTLDEVREMLKMNRNG